MNVFDDLTTRVRTAVRAALGSEGADLSRIVVEPAREAGHGELATNAAMVLAKPLGRKPRELADAIAAELRGDADIATVEVAGPGFINLTLAPSFWQSLLGSIIAADSAYGRSKRGAGEKVNVEYVSANPTGPMHVGHCRGAVVGDALASLLEANGYAVTREYYINDAGKQVEVLGESALLRYREALGETIGEIPEGLYPGDYLVPVGQALAQDYGPRLLNMGPEALTIARDTAVAMMMEMIRGDLAALNIEHDVFFSERSLIEGGTDRVAEAIQALQARGLIYEGRLPPPKGQVEPDWEDREQMLFRSTEFGDDVDRPLIKSDGSYTYFASDIAYHYDKYLRGFRQMIDVWGADHGGYIKRVQAAVKAVSGGEAAADVKICQLVNLFRAGVPVKMSKRSGNFVTLREVVQEVGVDPVRFMMVFRRNDAPLDFDFQKVTEQSKDNPVFYVQYAHARTCSVFRQAAWEAPDVDASAEALGRAELARLVDSGEIGLIRRLAEFPRVIESAGEAHEPHRIAYYLYELASEFHGHWNRGKEMPQLRFVNHGDRESTAARLALVHAVRLVLAEGLAILGVSAPVEMR
ncbi:MAG: arginine--tRNA ligase [Bauldia sp.]|nr:arginine--tRNA ligase [Bauldia sp.]